MKKNIFVLALDDFNLELLEGIRGSDRFRFHGLLEYRDLIRARRYPMHELLKRAERQLSDFAGNIDGLVVYWDFPASTMAPVLRRRFGLPGPSLESVLRCEHKYWSRLCQKQIVPELVPPFWLKPVRAHSEDAAS